MKFTAREGAALIGTLVVVGLITVVSISQASTSGSPQGPVPLPATTAPQMPEVNTDNATPPTEPEPPVTVTETVDQPVVTVTEVVTPSPVAPSTHELPPPTTVQPPAPPVNSDAAIRTEVSDAVGIVNTYWTKLFSGWTDKYTGQPSQWWTPRLYGGDGFYDTSRELAPICQGEPVGGATFCSDFNGSGWVSWDMEFFRPFAAVDNDVIYYLVVAHETAHAAQWRFIWDGEGPATTDATSVLEETQADCIAGATLATAVRDGYLLMEDGDEQEIRTVMEVIGDYENDHGTPDERYAAYERGYQSADIESCLGNRQH